MLRSSKPKSKIRSKTSKANPRRKSSATKSTKRVTKRKVTKHITKKRNPGGGWEFKGKSANQWIAYRELRGLQEAQDKEGDWWEVSARAQKRDFDNERGLSKGPGIVEILKVIKESDKKYKFVDSEGNPAPYIDWRIGYLSQGPEVQYRDGGWMSANVRISGNTVQIYDIRYDVRD